MLPHFVLAMQVVALWPNGAPGFERLKNEPERARDYWVRHINNPSITVYLPPKDKATGAAVVICPGGGFRELVFQAEDGLILQHARCVNPAVPPPQDWLADNSL